MKSKTSKNSSSTDQGDSQENSVFDFLYHDPQRIASFLSQFDENGHLTQVVQKAGKKSATNDSGQLSARLGVPFVGGGDANLSTTNTQSAEREGQRTYDPVWANSLLLLEYLTDQNFIQRHLPNANMGQFVLVKGNLWVIDLGLMKDIFSNPTVQGFLTSQSGAATAQQTIAMTMGVSLVTVIPHVTQAVLSAPSGLTWSSLNPAGLTMPAADLLMKHGFSIGGKWSILGVLDAVPDKALPPAPPASLGPYVTGLVSMAPSIRPMLGRPSDAYGITPLLIFREVS